MKKQITSVLGPAVLVLLVVGLAVWTVTQLTGGEAAAERLPTIVVGRDAASAGEPSGLLQPAGIPSTTVGGMTLETASVGDGTVTSGDGAGTSRTTTRASTAGPHSTSSPAADGTTMPGMSAPPSASMPTPTTSPGTTSTGTTMLAATGPAGGGGQATSTTATTRMVVPDPVREHEGGRSGGGTFTPGSMGTTPISGVSGTSGSMGH